MVMEYVEGRSLRALLSDLGNRARVAAARDRAADRRGTLGDPRRGHRPPRPQAENVLITDDQTVRIMDLGVAKLQEASVAITREGQFAGSVLYAAPEQFKGEPVEPAADLVLARRPAVRARDGRQPVPARRRGRGHPGPPHARPRPARPERNHELSGFFSEVSRCLLAKKPAAAHRVGRRAAHAARGRRTFGMVGASASNSCARASPTFRACRCAAESDLHGRDGDLKTLNDAWARAKDGEGNSILIEGEPGIGKSRLVDEFMRGLGEEPVHICTARTRRRGGPRRTQRRDPRQVRRGAARAGADAVPHGDTVARAGVRGARETREPAHRQRPAPGRRAARRVLPPHARTRDRAADAVGDRGPALRAGREPQPRAEPRARRRRPPHPRHRDVAPRASRRRSWCTSTASRTSSACSCSA